MTDRKRPDAAPPGRTLVRPGAVSAGAPAPRRLLGPGEIGTRAAAAIPDESGKGPSAAPTGEAPDPASKRRLSAQAFGLSAESKAAALLVAKGHRILARRWRSGYGEVDIVALHRGTLVFVEVKARERLDAAAEAILPRQRRRIVSAAEAWLGAHPEHAALAVRFDVILLAPGRLPRHIPAAFDSEG